MWNLFVTPFLLVYSGISLLVASILCADMQNAVRT